MIYANSSQDAIRELERQRLGEYEDFCSYAKEEEEICESCGETIYPGDDRLKCENGIFCRECIINMTSEDLVDLLGFSFTNSSDYYV